MLSKEGGSHLPREGRGLGFVNLAREWLVASAVVLCFIRLGCECSSCSLGADACQWSSRWRMICKHRARVLTT